MFIKYNDGIGLLTFDRPRTTCVHKTDFCKTHCYNNAVDKCWGWNIRDYDLKSEAWWQTITPKEFVEILGHRKINRMRWCTRGEIFSTFEDIIKVCNIIRKTPQFKHWLPTRAWRSELHRKILEALIMPLDNAYLMASIDPSNTKEDLTSIKNWNTMFFGDDEHQPFDKAFKCPKTWKKTEGYPCRTCNGCFSHKERHVWLKEH